jgi:pimeloyl-ACP methyl ester carboxylesterase
MHRRALLAAPALLAPAVLAARPVATPAAPPPRIATEEFMVPSGDAGIELFLRNKRPESLNAFAPNRTLLYVHGATFAHAEFDVPFGGVSWMDHIAARGFDVWCLDVRGFGHSTRPPEMARPASENPPVVRSETAVRDISAAAEFIRGRRSVPRLAVMGWSWGTVLMGRYAADNPGLVERVVLFAPFWTLQSPPAFAAGPDSLGAYRTVTQAVVRRVWLDGVPEDKKANLIPAGWFEQWAPATWATDPDGARQDPPVVRVPNGALQDAAEYWAPGKQPFYDPSKITAPALLVLGEWDRITPLYMATTLFPLLANSSGKRLVVLGEGTHFIFRERNRGALFQAVQSFLEEATA